MRELPEAPAARTLARLPKLGALSASAALILASFVPLTAAADETFEPEETITATTATDMAIDEATADEQRETAVVSEVDATTIAPADAEPVEQSTDTDATEANDPVTEPSTAQATDDALAESAEPVEQTPAESAEPSTSESAVEEPTAEETESVTPQQEDADTETEVWLTPSSPLTQAQLDAGANQILGSGFPANVAATVTIDGATVATGETLDNGGVNIMYNAFLEPGTYTIAITAGGETDATELMVTEGGYTLDVCVGEGFECYFDTILNITVWDMSRTGARFEVDGFRPNEVVTLTVNGNTVQDVTVNDNGFAQGTFTADLSPGTYSLTASSSIGSESYNFVVIADNWDEDEDTPSVEANRQYVTESWLQDNAITFSLRDYPEDTSIEVYLNGEYLETISYEWRAEYSLPQDLAVGDYTVEFRHPVANISLDIAVHPDEQGDPVFEGNWNGSANQTGAGSYDWSELENPPDDNTYPLNLEIDTNGNLTGLTGEFWWVCIGVQTGYIDSGYTDLANSQIPSTALTIDRPFDMEWEGSSHSYRLTGVLNSDGTASGMLWANLSACGTSTLVWETTYDGEVPEPSPEPTPDPTPDPTPTDEPTTDPTPTDEPTADPTPTDEPTADPTPTEEPTDEPTTDPTPTDEPTADPTPTEEPSQDPEPSDSAQPTVPVETPDGDESDGDDSDGDAAQSITVPETARAGDTITVSVHGIADGTQVSVWLFSDPVYLGTHTVADSAIQVTIPADTSPGEHQIAIYTADGELVAWDTITITTEESDGSAAGSGTTGSDSSSSTTGTGSSSSGTGSGLARTGTTIALSTISGLVLLAGGIMLLRRRRHNA